MRQARPMWPRCLALALVSTWSGLAQAAAPGVVEVTVSGVRDGRGHVLVAICPRKEFLRERCAHNGSAPAQAGSVVVRVEGVPPGTYAAQAWHDENDNGHIDRDLLGIPREGIGFSRDAPIRLGPPRFEDAVRGRPRWRADRTQAALLQGIGFGAQEQTHRPHPLCHEEGGTATVAHSQHSGEDLR